MNDYDDDEYDAYVPEGWWISLCVVLTLIAGGVGVAVILGRLIP